MGNAKIASIAVSQKSGTGPFGDIFIYQDEAVREAVAGKLFIIAELESKKPGDGKIIPFLFENIKNNYYKNEKLVLRENLGTVNIDSILSASLSKSNRDFSLFLNEEKIKFSRKKISLTAGVICEDKIYFSLSGRNRAFLVARVREKEKTIYKLFDIMKNDEERTDPARGANLFSEIMIGSVPNESFCVFTNEALPEYLHGKMLVKILSSLPLKSAAEQIKNELSAIGGYVPFFGVIIKNEFRPEKEAKTEKLNRETAKHASSIADNRTNPLSSPADLSLLEKETEAILEPSHSIGLKSFFGRFLKLILSRKKELSGKVPALREKIFTKRRSQGASIKRRAIRIFESLIFIFVFFPSSLAKNFFPSMKRLAFSASDSTKKSMAWFLGLKKKHKIYLSIFFACVVFLSANIFWSRYKERISEQKTVFENLIASVQQKQNQIASSLLYGNEETARKLLDESEAIIARLKTSGTGDPRLADAEKRYQDQLERLKKETVIDNPEKLADFSLFGGEAGFIAFNPIEPDKIYASARDGGLYKLSLNDKTATQLENFSEKIYVAAIDQKSDRIYFYGDGKVIVFGASSESSQTATIDPALNRDSMPAMAAYNQRLYLINTREGQIYRYKKSGSDYALEKRWLNENADLSAARAISVEESIFLLFADGTLEKLSGGSTDADFSLDLVEPPLDSSDKIYISPSSDLLIILDGKNKRILIFKKNGSFVKQYVLPSIDNLKDFAIDEKNGKIYLLAASSVYAITPEF